MKYSARDLRSKDNVLLRRVQRMSEADDEKKDSGLLYEGFLGENSNWKEKKEKERKEKKFTKLHLYLNNSRSKGRN